MRPPLSLIPLLPVAIALAAGIFICGYISPLLMEVIAVISVGVAVGSAIFNRRATAIIAGAFALGVTAFFINDGREEAENIAGKRAAARGAVIDTRTSNSTQILTVKIEEYRHNEGKTIRPNNLLVSVVFPSFYPEILTGDEVAFSSEFSSIKSRIFLPDEIDVADILHRKGIYLQTLVTPDSLTHLTDRSTLRAWIARSGRHLTDVIFRSPLSSESKEFLATAIAGQDATLTDGMRETFAKAGLAHVLALSGLHAGIIAGLLMLLLWPLKLTRARRVLPLFIIIALWGFAIVTGMSPSVTRAAIMATVVLGALMLQRRHSPFNALCLAAILILVFDPLALRTAGFILSFLAVTGIILFSEKINPVTRRNRLIYPIVAAIAVTLSSVLATGFVSVLLFHTFPVYFLLANLIAAPLLPVIIGGGVVMTLCGLVGWYPPLLCQIIDTLCHLLLVITDWIASLPGSTVDNIYLRAPEIIAGTAAICGLAAALYFKRRIYWFTTVALTLCAMILMSVPDKKTGYGVRIVASASHTDIIASSPEAMDIITTAPRRDHEAILADALLRYRHHLGKRGIATVRISSTSARNSVCTYSDNLLVTGSRRILIVGADTIVRPYGKLDLLIVCRGFKGDIVGAANIARADSVLLSSDLNPIRRRRYEAECIEAGINVRNLADSPYNSESCL